MGYWNRWQTMDILGLFATNENLKGFKEKWQGLKNGRLTQEEVEGLDRAIKEIEKVLELLCNSVDAGTQRKLLNSSKEYRVGLIPKDQKMFKETAKKELGDDCAYVSTAALAKLAELALQSTCGPCVCKGNKAECKARGAFIDLDIPFFDDDPPEGVCPYEIQKDYWEDERELRLRIMYGIPTERLAEMVLAEKEKEGVRE